MQIGFPPGTYKITVEKDGLTTSKTQRIGLDMAEVNFTLKKGGDTAEMSKGRPREGRSQGRECQGRLCGSRGARQRGKVRRVDSPSSTRSSRRSQVHGMLRRHRYGESGKRRITPR
jgi:hypothetical protein